MDRSLKFFGIRRGLLRYHRKMLDKARLTDGEALAIARGLHHIAEVNGIDPREAGLLEAFWEDVGGDYVELMRAEKSGAITPDELKRALSSEESRAVFLRLAFMLSTMDGVMREEELARIQRFAEAFETDAAVLRSCEAEARLFLDLRKQGGGEGAKAQ